jgi:hypothetical protein
MKDKIYCSGGQQIATMSFRINDLPEAHHWYGGLCTHQIWIGKQMVYDGRVHLPWSQPDADVLGDIRRLINLVRDNPTMTVEELMQGFYTEGE